MLKQISWTECFIYFAVGLIVYYAVVAIVFYRKEFYALFRVRHKKDRHDGAVASFTPTKRASENALYDQVLELMQDCKPVFKAAVENSLEKAQVIEALQFQLKKYPQIIGTAFQVAVSNHIDQELQARCGLSLTEDDIETLWK